jgi:hypothetical protein
MAEQVPKKQSFSLSISISIIWTSLTNGYLENQEQQKKTDPIED